MVMEVSAMFVARTTLRVLGAARFKDRWCSVTGSCECITTTDRLPGLILGLSASRCLTWQISSHPGNGPGLHSVVDGGDEGLGGANKVVCVVFRFPDKVLKEEVLDRMRGIWNGNNGDTVFGEE